MAMTASVKDELARLEVTKQCCRKAEVSALLRFGGGLHIVSGKIVIEAELDTGAAARRLRRDIAEVYGHESDIAVVSAGGLRKGSRYVVRVVNDGETLARQTGLIDGSGRPVRGLPPQVVSGSTCDAEAAWRGAFLAHGSLTEPGRSSAVEVTCPGPEAALALVGAARRIGIQAKARDVRGIDRVVSGSTCDAEAAWRGAFLAHGSLTEPGRSSAIEVTCPGPEAALALVGAARRIGIQAKARDVRGIDRVVVRDGDAIGALLTRLGAHDSVLAWEERRMRREVRATANRLANFDDANLRRSARAAVAAGARVERALEILADDVPEHLRVAGLLRLEHKQASLEELGQLSDPPMTKDAVAGRIRRLLAMADRKAAENGIPGTDANLTPDMLVP